MRPNRDQALVYHKMLIQVPRRQLWLLLLILLYV